MTSHKVLSFFLIGFAFMTMFFPNFVFSKEPKNDFMKMLKDYHWVVAGIIFTIGMYILSSLKKTEVPGYTVDNEISSDTVSSGLLDLPDMDQKPPSYDFNTTST